MRLHSAGLIRMGRLRGNGGLGPGCYDTIGGWEPRGRGLLLLYYSPPDGSSVWGLMAAGGSVAAAVAAAASGALCSLQLRDK